MTEQETTKRFGCGRILLTFVLLLVGLIIAWSFINFRGGPQAGEPVVPLATETTKITQPLDESGDPDYIEFLNQMYSSGVTPENNAVVLMIQANGPTLERQPISEEFYRRLGIDPLPLSGDYLIPFVTYQNNASADNLAAIGSSSPELREKQFNFAIKNPWTETDLPELAAWLESNRQPLELLRQSTLRPRYYHPMIDPSVHPMVMGILLPLAQAQRHFVNIRAVIAMQHLGDGNITAAFDETLTIRRHARLAQQSASAVERMIAYALELLAVETEWRIAQSGKATMQELLDYRAKINALPPLSDATECYEHCERYMMLDTICQIARNKAIDDPMWNDTGAMSFLFSACDWETAMNVTNPYFDRIIEAMNKETYQEMKTESELYDQDLKMLQAELRDPLTITKAIVGGRNAKGEYMGKLLATQFMPGFRGAVEANYSAQAFHRLSLIVLSLEAYKLDRGGYPQYLDELIPGYGESLPLDPFVEEPFRYKRKDASYQIYSVGNNMTDDQGIAFDDPKYDGDDLSPSFTWKTWSEVQRQAENEAAPVE
jgi:hypothetical protein